MKPANISLRPTWKMSLLLFLACTSSLFSQSLTVFGVDASAYPTMRAKFYAFDANGNQLTGLSPGDLQLREDGIARTITRISCPPVSPPVAISSVLTIDVSISMLGARIQVAKAGARAWIDALAPGRSECALTSFDECAYLNQDFTTDRTVLLQAIDALSWGGGTDFDAALLTPPAGALEVSKRGQYRKVIVFLSDGAGKMEQQSEIIAEARRQNATIYALILGMSAPKPVIDICAATGGVYFEHVSTEAEATDMFLRILQIAQGGAPCELEWTSEGCAASRTLEVTLTSPAATASVNYVIPSSVVPHLVYTPSRFLRFGGVAPDTQSLQQVTLTAQGGTVRIDAVTVTHPRFSIIDYGGAAPPFTLAMGQSRTLRVAFAPTDSTYSNCRFEVQSDACLGTAFYADGGWPGKPAPLVTVTVLRPNGGEIFVAGSQEELTWEGVMPEDSVRLEYSVDGGTTWQEIRDGATGLRHAWRVPKQPSERCLLRVTADTRPTIIEDMALIPAGTFRMGDITGTGYIGERPVHEVTITRPFLMSRTEVTQERYEAVMGSNPSSFKGPDLPVEQVSWYDAVQFCNELSRLEGLDPCYIGSDTNIVYDFTANGYRLPTEAEWEYACRAGTETDFHTGNMTSPWGFDPALDRAGWFNQNSRLTSHPVGGREPNAFGLYDTHGNVCEWCWDWCGDGYYAASPADDPRGPASGSYRVTRSGSWCNFARDFRSAARDDRSPSGRSNTRGFRVVRTY